MVVVTCDNTTCSSLGQRLLLHIEEMCVLIPDKGSLAWGVVALPSCRDIELCIHDFIHVPLGAKSCCSKI